MSIESKKELSEFYDLLGSVYNYRRGHLSILFRHNQIFFSNTGKEAILVDLLKNKCALGESKIGSSVYKRYCSEVNETIQKLSGCSNYLKMVKMRTTSEAHKVFLESIKEPKLLPIKVKPDFRKVKTDLYKRLVFHNRASSTKINEKWDDGLRESNKSSSSEPEKTKNVIDLEINYDKSYLEALSSLEKVIEREKDKVRTGHCPPHSLSILKTSGPCLLPVPELKERVRSITVDKVIDPLEAYYSKKNIVRARAKAKIEDFIKENDPNSPGFSEKLKRVLYYTREFKEEDFRVKVKEDLVSNNQSEIDKVLEENRVRTLSSSSCSKETQDQFISKTWVIMSKIMKHSLKGKRESKLRVETTELKNTFSELSTLDEETEVEINGLSKKFKGIMEKDGAVRTLVRVIGKRATKIMVEESTKSKMLESSRKDKNGFITPKVLHEGLINMAVKISNNKMKSSNKKISEKSFGYSSVITNQIVRRVKMMKITGGFQQNRSVDGIGNKEIINVKGDDTFKRIIESLEVITDGGWPVIYKDILYKFKKAIKMIKLYEVKNK